MNTSMGMSVSTFLQLGRVSNLPTVWSNCLAGMILTAASFQTIQLLLLLVAMTLAYTGGMFLNDAFDHRFDKKHKPERPIPAGLVSLSAVRFYGYAMLASSVLIVSMTATLGDENVSSSMATVSAIALAGCIVLYNAWHKRNPLSPLIMGLCRMLIYCTAGWTLVAVLPAQLLIAALVLLCYLIGLTYVAKQELSGSFKNFWPLLFLFVPLIYALFLANSAPWVWLPLTLLAAWLVWVLYLLKRRRASDIGQAVVSMIAGISLLDAMFIAANGHFAISLLAIAFFVLTLFLQRYVSGT